MQFILTYHWHLFVTIEVLSFVSLLLFGVFRYFFDKRALSRVFIASFFMLLLIEALLGIYVYRHTGEISTFLIVIMVFLVYAPTFGVVDFIRLDRWMREKIGNIRGVELLTEKDRHIIQRNRDPKYIAKKYRINSMIHLVIFVIGQLIFWSMGTDSFTEMKSYLTDLSWINDGAYENSPYPNEVMFGVGMVWGIAFVADFIYSWSYTFFPNK